MRRGPLCYSQHGIEPIDDGTLCRTRSPDRGPTGLRDGLAVQPTASGWTCLTGLFLPYIPKPVIPVDYWTRAIQLFGGKAISTQKYKSTVDDYQKYLTAVGVKHFSAKEMTTPNHRDKAKKAGYTVLLPEFEWWPRGAALGLLADKIRNHVGESVTCRNWWRPQNYNKLVAKSGPKSDHPHACGVDLDFTSSSSRRKAAALLKGIDRKNLWLKMSLGLGGRSIHVGLLSPKGRRTWKYASYRP